MLRKSLHCEEPSLFYLIMAESCFQRAVSTRHPKAGGTLREIGRHYLAKANEVASTLEPQARTRAH
jgi:hypothetical protein